MNAEEAIDLLLGFSTVKDSAKNLSLASLIVKELGYLALPIVQAGAYISKGCSWNEYLNIFQKDHAQLLSKHPVQMIDDYPWAVYATWEISFKKLKAATLLHLCAFLHYRGISKTIFQRASLMDLDGAFDDTEQLLHNFQTTDGDWSDFQFQEIINELASYSLISTDEEDNTFFLRPLVHAWAQERLQKTERDHREGCTMQILALTIPDGSSTEDNTFRRMLLPVILGGINTFYPTY
jgi:hypothetical protein